MTEIKKSKRIINGFYINGKGILSDNWEHHKLSSLFNTKEKRDFDNYLKALKDEQ